MRRAIVTGGTGFIGSYLVRELLEEGLDVTVLARGGMPDAWNEDDLPRERLHFIAGTIENAREAGALLNGTYDICYHLAWAGVAPEHKNDLELQIRNLTSALQVLEMAHEAGCRRFLMAGTVAEYVRCEGAMDPYLRGCPSDFYGASKASAYYYTKVRAEQLGMEHIWTIVPSTFGPGRRDNNLLTYTIRTLLKGEKPSFGNLAQMWDFLYVGEVARGLAYAGEKGCAGKIYGIGSGIYRPLRAYVEEIRDLIDPTLPLGIGERPDQSGITSSSCVDNTLLAVDTGFTPRDCYREMMEKTIDWYRQGN